MPQHQPVKPRLIRFWPSETTSYVFGWWIVGAILVIDAIGMHCVDFTLQTGSFMSICKSIAVLGGTAIVLSAVRAVPRYKAITTRFFYPQVSNIAAWWVLILSFALAMCVMSYLSVAIDAPLIEQHLIKFDRAIGFDWLATYHWVQSHPHVQRVLAFAYMSGHYQLLGIPFILGLSARREALPEFFFLLAFASILLMITSTPFPAESAFVAFNINDPGTASSVSDFAALRSGALRAVDPVHTQGLVSMPSFHTALAVLFAYSLRHVRWLFGVAIALNLTMILSTPTEGGHYLADVGGGLLLAALTIQLVRMFYRRRSADRFALPVVVAVRDQHQQQPLNSASP